MKVCSVCRRCYYDSAVSCGGECYEPLSETHSGCPEMIDGYHLDLLVESGVKGRLFQARQIECGQSCFIKVLSADEVNSRRFLDEAKIAAAFFHPNLADIYEVGSIDSGEVFVVAEKPDGQTLREVLDSDGTPPLLTTIQVARQTAEALHSVHLKGLLHRALNPENIILTTDHENELLVRIRNLDFGGVAQRSIISNKFLIDSALDSIRYFSPEQCSGDGASVQTDVYSLGIVLYEMLAGAPPFDAVNAAGLMEKQRNQHPPECKIANFDLRMLLTHTLTESLQKNPQMRQPSASTFARQIRHMEQLATHVSTPPPAGAVPVRWAPRPTVSAVSAVSNISQTVSEAESLAVKIEKTIETAQPLAAKIQESVETAPLEIFDSPLVFKDGSEPASVIESERSEFETSPFAEPLATDFPPEEPKLVEKGHWLRRQVSRLKLHRKRLLLAKSDQEAFELRQAEAQARMVQAFAKVEPEQATATGVRKPTLIEWEQSEDDIPSVSDVIEVLSKEQIDPAPLIHAEPQELIANRAFGEPVVETAPEKAASRGARKPTFIEWDQPVGDISSVTADPREPLLLPTQADPRGLPVVLAKAEPVVIEWGLLLKNFPSKPEAVTVLPKRQVPRIPSAQADTEEITLVRPLVSRFTVDLERLEAGQGPFPAGKLSYGKPTPVEFTPTLLENSRRRKTFEPEVKDTMFSTFYGKPATRFSAGRLVLSGIFGFTAVAAAFLFGGDLVTKYLQASGPSDSEAATIKSSLVEAKKPVSSSRKKGSRTVKSSRPDNRLTKGDPSRISDGAKSTRTIVSASAASDSRKKERQNGSEKKTPDTAPTRPRVVKAPKR